MGIKFQTSILVFLVAIMTVSAQIGNFDVHVAELNGIRMISTSDYNYAMSNPNFSQNWRTVSVNGDDVIIATRDNQIYTRNLMNLSDIERNEIAQTKTQLSQVIQYGGSYNNMNGGGSYSAVNYNNNNQHQAKYTTYSSSGNSMSSSSSNGGGSNQMSQYTLNDISFSMNNDNDFAVYRKDNMPFNWSRVFVDGDLFTTVLTNGDVHMKPLAVTNPNELKQLESLRAEIKNIAQQQQQQFSNTMQNSMNMMQNIMGNNQQQLNYQMNPMHFAHPINPAMNLMNPQLLHQQQLQQQLYRQQMQQLLLRRLLQQQQQQQQQQYHQNQIPALNNNPTALHLSHPGKHNLNSNLLGQGNPASNGLNGMNSMNGINGMNGMFGNNFPFGPDNSPFGDGFPFGSGGGGGASAFAFSGGR